MKSLFIVFVTLFFIIAMPWVFDLIRDTRTDQLEQSFAGVTTGAGAYSANVTLSDSLSDSHVIAVSDITSNVTSDTPSAYTYNSVSKVLTVSGLNDSHTRTLVITYDIENASLNPGIIVFCEIFPWFYFLLVIGLTCGAVYAFFHD